MLKISIHDIFFRYVVFVTLSLLTTILPVAEAIAQLSISHIKVKGTGNTQSEAVTDALMEAVYRIYGVRIASDTQSSVSRIRSDNTATLVAEIHKVVRRQTASDKRNELLGYEVVSSQQDSAGLHTVAVQARYSRYRVPGPENKRRTLAVMNFSLTGGGYIPGNAREVADFLASQIESLLVQGRRFAVLDRKRNDIYAREKELIQSGDMNIAERARLGKVLGADYMVYGEILPVRIEKIDKSIKILGEHKEQIVASVPVRFKVLAVATRQVKWSSSVVADHIVENTNKDYVVETDLVVGSALGKVAELIVDELTENIYPPKIAKVLTANRFVLNRGGNTVENGMLFEVFNVGEYVLDPDTGERLDRIETFAGLARVVEKKPKYSIAEIETDEPIREGMVLRKYRGVDSKAKQHVAAQSSYQDNDNDGLPDYLNLLNTDRQP